MTATSTADSKAENKLLSISDRKNESNIRAIIRACLKEWGADISSEWKTDADFVNLYLKNRRMIIEVKAEKWLDKGVYVVGTGGNANDSALTQLENAGCVA